MPSTIKLRLCTRSREGKAFDSASLSSLSEKISLLRPYTGSYQNRTQVHTSSVLQDELNGMADQTFLENIKCSSIFNFGTTESLLFKSFWICSIVSRTYILVIMTLLQDAYPSNVRRHFYKCHHGRDPTEVINPSKTSHRRSYEEAPQSLRQ